MSKEIRGMPAPAVRKDGLTGTPHGHAPTPTNPNTPCAGPECNGTTHIASRVCRCSDALGGYLKTQEAGGLRKRGGCGPRNYVHPKVPQASGIPGTIRHSDSPQNFRKVVKA